MLRIGDFSRLTNIPIKTIRYYDEIGLLKPTSVCIENNYRYYGMDQLIALNKILALKDAGFTLEEIRHLMKERLSRDEFLNLLNNKLSIAEHELTFTQMKVSNLRARIKHIKNEEDYKMVDVTVKKIEPILVAAIRKSVDTDKHGSLYGIIIDDVAAHGVKEVGPILCVRHDDVSDWEACIQIGKKYIPGHPDVTVHYLPAVEKMACIIYKGAWGDAMKPTMDEFVEWLKLNGLEWIHPRREIFHYGERENPGAVHAGDSRSSTFITEVQYPIR